MRAAGQVPEGNLVFIHGTGDTLADPTEAKAFANGVSARAKYLEIDTAEHIRANHPIEQKIHGRRGRLPLGRLVEGAITSARPSEIRSRIIT